VFCKKILLAHRRNRARSIQENVMSLFFVTRPSPEPAGWDIQRGAPLYQYTRHSSMQHSRDAAVRIASRVRGRAYEYDGRTSRLIFEAPDAPGLEHAPLRKGA
jgi:hypothetical protein